MFEHELCESGGLEIVGAPQLGKADDRMYSHAINKEDQRRKGPDHQFGAEKRSFLSVHPLQETATERDA